jgi:DNA-binding NtrC family response regulator
MKSNSDFSVFLVDDDPFFLSLLERLLHNCGYSKITTFESGTAFLNSLEKKPDIILLDYNMDSMNGLETLKKIKRFNPNALVVFISGQENIDVAVNALKYGAFDYLLKDQINVLKINHLMEKGIALNEMIRKNYKKNVLHRVLSTIGIPVLVYAIFETFFR